MHKTTQKRVDELLKKINSQPPSPVITGIYKYQEEHITWLTKNYWGFTKYFEESYDFFVNLVSSVNFINKDKWKWNLKLPYIYLGNSTYPLFKSFTLLSEGFYDESLALSRVSYELLIKSLFCILHPDDAFATYQKPEKGKLVYNLTNFVKDDLKVDWEFLYRLSSASSHGKLYFTKIISDSREKGKHQNIGLQLRLDEKSAQINMNYLTFLIWTHIYLFTVIFDDIVPTRKINSAVKKEANDYIKILGNIVKGTPNSFSGVGIDFERIIKKVKVQK